MKDITNTYSTSFSHSLEILLLERNKMSILGVGSTWEDIALAFGLHMREHNHKSTHCRDFH